MSSIAKVWLITCDCRGLVQALAEAVLASGHNLVATAVDTKPLRELVERYGDQLRIVPIEVTDGSGGDAAIEATLSAFGRLDVLVLDVAKWRSVLATRLGYSLRSGIGPSFGRPAPSTGSPQVTTGGIPTASSPTLLGSLGHIWDSAVVTLRDIK